MPGGKTEHSTKELKERQLSRGGNGNPQPPASLPALPIDTSPSRGRRRAGEPKKNPPPGAKSKGRRPPRTRAAPKEAPRRKNSSRADRGRGQDHQQAPIAGSNGPDASHRPTGKSRAPRPKTPRLDRKNQQGRGLREERPNQAIDSIRATNRNPAARRDKRQ